ncbi:MAG TPA: right-handed parallel beta-helix repeat-containing protein [Solirubrobacterales bacterium]|nr:right-handed parallel beta-helix repeat-containing protein [Solirubrobacterales bacterium]
MPARKARHRRGTLIVAIAIAAVAVLLPALAFAHIERASYWPDPAADTSVNPPAGGAVPDVRSLYTALKVPPPGETRVVCQPDSLQRLDADLAKAQTTGYKLRASQPAIRLSKKEAKTLRHFNVKLLKRCEYSSIQDAVNDSHNNDRVEIMPGLYTEPKSRAKPTNDPACDQYEITNDKGQVVALSYAYQVHCPNDQNLIAVLGRGLSSTPVPQPPLLDRHNIPDAGPCIRCNLQIQGTGATPDAVTVDAGNTASGDGAPIGSVKDIVIRADRADGFVLDNVKLRHSDEHGIYVTETDGSHLNRLKALYSAEYPILTFVADHSLIENCDAWGAGDAAIYPGGSADLGEELPPDQRRYGTEIRNCDMHHSALGYSGTNGNAVWIHDNEIYDNTMGLSTDVFTAPGHPGFPQDSDLIEKNNFYSNNFNTYLPACPGTQKPGPNGPSQGCSDVESTVPVAVGVGLWIAGGNANIVRNNRFWDNWRRGTMLFAIPDILVCPPDSDDQVPGCNPVPLDPPITHDVASTSYRNQFYGNKMGVASNGSVQPNGEDFWWDQGGLVVDPTFNSANCWYDNTGKDGTAASVTATPSPTGTPPDNLPSDCGNSPLIGGSGHGQTAELLGCNTGAPSCTWFTTPPKP